MHISHINWSRSYRGIWIITSSTAPIVITGVFRIIASRTVSTRIIITVRRRSISISVAVVSVVSPTILAIITPVRIVRITTWCRSCGGSCMTSLSTRSRASLASTLGGSCKEGSGIVGGKQTTLVISHSQMAAIKQASGICSGRMITEGQRLN